MARGLELLYMARLSHTVVACYSLDGRLVKTYPSAKEAARSRKLFPRTIDHAIRGDVLTVKGLQWKRFRIDEVPGVIPPLQLEKKTRSIKAVAKVDEQGRIIETYPSIKKASELNHLDPHSLRDRISGKYAQHEKEKFRLLSEEEIQKFGYQVGSEKTFKKRAIIQYTLDGRYVKTYASINRALIELDKVGQFKGLSDCLKGKYSSAFGFRWKYQGEKKNLEPGKTLILQYDQDGHLIGKYPSTKEASMKTKISVSSLNNCLRGYQKSAGGFFWKRKSN